MPPPFMSKLVKLCGIAIGLLTSGLLAAPLRAAEGPVAIDRAASRVEISVKATVDSFVARLVNYEAAITADPATGRVGAARFAFHFADVKTGNDKRDREMNEWQQTDHFPDGAFTLASLADQGGGKSLVKGTLTLHGVTRPIEFTATLHQEARALTVDGEAVVDTRLFGLPVIRKFALLKVDPLVVVHFHLVGSVPAS